jgi:hypothetical protein
MSNEKMQSTSSDEPMLDYTHSLLIARCSLLPVYTAPSIDTAVAVPAEGTGRNETWFTRIMLGHASAAKKTRD